MTLKSFIVRQLGRPSGWFAPLAALFLNRGNADQNRDCIDALGLEPGFEVLDVGFGGGVSIPRLLEECSEGRVVATDISSEMVTRARSKWAREIEAKRLEVVECGADRMSFADGRFERAMTVNTLYFWPDLAGGLAEVLRVLAPGGRFVASVVPAEMLESFGFPSAGFRAEAPEYYVAALEAAGYAEVRADPTDDGKGATLLSGVKPA